MTQSPQNNEEGPDFNAADGEGDQVQDVATTEASVGDRPAQAASQSKQQRTKALLPDSSAGDEGGSRLESNPN